MFIFTSIDIFRKGSQTLAPAVPKSVLLETI